MNFTFTVLRLDAISRFADKPLTWFSYGCPPLLAKFKLPSITLAIEEKEKTNPILTCSISLASNYILTAFLIERSFVLYVKNPGS